MIRHRLTRPGQTIPWTGFTIIYHHYNFSDHTVYPDKLLFQMSCYVLDMMSVMEAWSHVYWRWHSLVTLAALQNLNVQTTPNKCMVSYQRLVLQQKTVIELKNFVSLLCHCACVVRIRRVSSKSQLRLSLEFIYLPSQYHSCKTQIELDGQFKIKISDVLSTQYNYICCQKISCKAGNISNSFLCLSSWTLKLFYL